MRIITQKLSTGGNAYMFRADNITDARTYFEGITFDKLSAINKKHYKSSCDSKSDEVSRRRSMGWYGDPKKVKISEMENGITQFIEPLLLQSIFDKVKDKIPASVISKFQKKKLKFNRNFGVFSFDRAASAMFWLDEYYSPEHKKTVELEEVNHTGNEYRLKTDNSPVVKRKETREDGSPFVRTLIEDVFVYFPPVKKDSKSVLIYVAYGAGANVSAERLLYSGVIAAVLAQLFEKARVKVAIHGLWGSTKMLTTKFNSKGNNVNKEKDITVQHVPIKNFHETLDKNAVALFSDARQFRYEQFKWYIKMANDLGMNVSESLGGIIPNIGKTLTNFTDYFQNDPEARDSAKIFVPAIFSEEEALKFIENTVKSIYEE